MRMIKLQRLQSHLFGKAKVAEKTHEAPKVNAAPIKQNEEPVVNAEPKMDAKSAGKNGKK